MRDEVAYDSSIKQYLLRKAAGRCIAVIQVAETNKQIRKQHSKQLANQPIIIVHQLKVN